VATKIRLMRMGKIRAPYYRIVVADARTKRDGRAIETIGKYHPKDDPSLIELDSDRVQYWLGVGAQPTEPVRAILRKTGDWQRYAGEPAPEPLLQPASRPDRKAVFAQAAREAAGQPGDEPKKRAERRPARRTADAASEAAPESTAEAAPESTAEPAPESTAEPAPEPTGTSPSAAEPGE
jgi:small subunit ribosomal protein S16